jgi:hypothetical protein
VTSHQNPTITRDMVEAERRIARYMDNMSALIQTYGHEWQPRFLRSTLRPFQPKRRSR